MSIFIFARAFSMYVWWKLMWRSLISSDRTFSRAIAKSAGLTSCRDATRTIATPCGVAIASLTVPAADENATDSIAGLRPMFGITAFRVSGLLVTAARPALLAAAWKF